MRTLMTIIAALCSLSILAPSTEWAQKRPAQRPAAEERTTTHATEAAEQVSMFGRGR